MTTVPQGLLSIIIVNYNSGDLLLDCIRSVLRFQSTCALELIVVDNSKNEKERQTILNAFPMIQWIDMGYNAGFARANNAGMRAAKGDAILLLNPDTCALDQSIGQCYERLMQSKYSAAGIQLLNEGYEPQISGSYFVKGGLNHLLPIPYWGSFIRWLAYSAGKAAPGIQNVPTEQEVDWISGAFLMVKRNSIEKAGLMDEDFFLYGEEVEWCSRLKKAGSLVLFGDLKIVHLEGATINKSQNIKEEGYYNLYDRKGLQLMVSNHLRVRKQYGLGWFFFLLCNYTWGWFFFFVCSTLHHLFFHTKPSKDWKRVGRFGKNLLQLWQLLPSFISAKPRFYKMF